MTSSEPRSYDAIVIGGGHNGLVCAAMLGKSGRKVLVLEAAAELGGAARGEEFAPGFKASLAHILNRLHPEVISALDLAGHGLKLGAAVPSIALSAAGEPLVLHGAYGDRLEGATSGEAKAWKELRAQLIRYAGIMKPLLTRRPPDLDGMPLSESRRLRPGRTGAAPARQGGHARLPAHAADERRRRARRASRRREAARPARLRRHARQPSRAALADLAARPLLPPDRRDCQARPARQTIPAGGMGAVVAAIARRRRKGRRDGTHRRPVGRIIVEKGRAVGVVLASGEEIRARSIVSAANPRATFLDLVGARELDTGFVRKVGNIRMKGDVAKLHLALDKPPAFAGVSAENHRGRLVIAPSPDHVERAFNPCKYGEFSPEPVMEITLPSLADPSLAPSGACVLSANVQYAPYALKEGWATGKPKFLDGDHGHARALCARHRQDRASRRIADARRHRGALPACRAAIGTMANCRPTRC